jgi:hypothetical protein
MTLNASTFGNYFVSTEYKFANYIRITKESWYISIVSSIFFFRVRDKGSETLSVTLREEHRLREFESRVLGRMSGVEVRGNNGRLKKTE